MNTIVGLSVFFIISWKIEVISKRFKFRAIFELENHARVIFIDKFMISTVASKEHAKEISWRYLVASVYSTCTVF